ncbi:hypothetical protein TNCT_224421 [Trichonephila clavata]|uniref:Uncharacterized protein n=1 Tax=Trichonephila clavata TaxID=2740835 RepID=A0A8X6G358_TRICU|nr:hypothetical protein TNCT_224421 [Trichonephila clavata]
MPSSEQLWVLPFSHTFFPFLCAPLLLFSLRCSFCVSFPVWIKKKTTAVKPTAKVLWREDSRAFPERLLFNEVYRLMEGSFQTICKECPVSQRNVRPHRLNILPTIRLALHASHLFV